MIRPAHCRAARALLNWSQEELAERVGVTKKTVADFERGARHPHEKTLAAIQAAFEQSRVELIFENGGGVGVRYATPLPFIRRYGAIADRQHLAVTFDYRGQTAAAFISFEAIAELDHGGLAPAEVFERHLQQLVGIILNKFDAGERREDGAVLIGPADIKPLPSPHPDD